MKFYLFILKLGLLVPFNASSQKDSVPLTNFSNYINDSLLVDIELLYHYDSLQANSYKYFGVKYPKYSYLYNQGKISEIPDSILEVRNWYNNLYLDYCKKKVQVSTRMVEISKPYFFDNFKKCVVITYKHLNDFRKAELLFFKVSGLRWELKAKVDSLVNIEY